jgi:ribosomal protein S18 acetylase RimI-like enzyme
MESWLDWRSAAALPHPKAMAELIHAADPEFYAAFGLAPPDRDGAIIAALSDRASDLGQWSLLLVDGEPAGLFAGYSMAEMMARQMAGLRHLLAKVADVRAVRAALKDFAGTRRTMAADAFYLARIAVGDNHRGRGLGRKVLERYEATARDAGFPATALHVRRGNAAAERLYARAGYLPAADDNGLPYAALKKALA